jgi:hypothetical protein
MGKSDKPDIGYRFLAHAKYLAAFIEKLDLKNITLFCPNEEIGEGIILIEEGEYRCRACNNLIVLYRKFNNI